jgi:hypothetical protein
MAFNFPSSPTNGQIFTPVAGLSYRWDSTKALWETVPMSSGKVTAQPYNMLVNPCFAVSQEWNNTALTGGDRYPADQWMVTVSNLAATNIAAQRIQSTTTMGSKNRMRLSNTVTSAMPGGNEYAAILQWIEGVRTTRLCYGWPQALPSVIRFWVKAPAGNWSVAIRNADSTRGRAFLYNISAGEANTLVEKNIVVPGDVGGGTNGTPAKWGNSLTGRGMDLWFTFACSTPTLLWPTGSWVDGNVIAATGMTNGVAAVNTFEIADVGWYADPYNTGLPPRWEARSEDKVFNDCQRYWYPCRDMKGISGATTYMVRGATRAPVPMRINPAVSIGAVGGYACNAWDSATLNAISSISGNYCSRTHLELDLPTVANTALGYMSQQLNEIASYPGYLAVNARLVG